MKLSLPLTLCCFSFVLAACQKDLSEPELEEIAAKCSIATAYYYDGNGDIYDSAIFTYGTDAKLIKVENEFESVHYSYTGSRITGRRFYDRAFNDLYYQDSIVYDGDNISRIISLDHSTWPSDTLQSRLDLTYQAGRLSRITYTEWVNSINYTDSFITVAYTSNAGNIEKLVYLDDTGDPIDSIAYQFDTKPNYFKAAHPHFILFDPFFQVHAGFEPHLPYFNSSNNVTKFIIYDTEEYPVEYSLDSLSKVTGLKVGGESKVGYRYVCQ